MDTQGAITLDRVGANPPDLELAVVAIGLHQSAIPRQDPTFLATVVIAENRVVDVSDKVPSSGKQLIETLSAWW